MTFTNKTRYNDVKFTVPKGTISLIDGHINLYSTYKNKGIDYYKYIYIIHHITHHYISNYLNHLAAGKLIQYNGCPLHQNTLSSIIGTGNKETSAKLKALEKLGLIQKIGGYLEKGYAQHYTLIVEPEDFDTVVALPKYTKIAAKLIKKRNEKLYQKNETLDLYRAFLSKVTLDIPINSTYYINDVEEIQDFDYCTVQSTKASLYSLNAIKNGEWFVHRPDAKSRVHTNLTNLNRDFRGFLRYEGEHFVELDIRNSQPLIASILIKSYWLQQNMDIPSDVLQYQKDCEAGIFYDYFMKINNIGNEERGEFKKQMFSEVFFSRVTKRMTRLKKQFIEKYPSAMVAINYIKGGLNSDNYNQFAIQLQRKEASIIFDKINVDLLKMNIPAFNIFDSILCMAEHRELVENKLIDAFSSINVTPTINYKDYKS